MMKMKCQVRWWRKPEYPEETTDLRHRYTQYLGTLCLSTLPNTWAKRTVKLLAVFSTGGQTTPEARDSSGSVGLYLMVQIDLRGNLNLTSALNRLSSLFRPTPVTTPARRVPIPDIPGHVTFSS